MVDAAIVLIIYLLVIAAVIYLVFWAIETVAGVGIPPKVQQIIWVIYVLIAVLLLLRLILPRLAAVPAMLPLFA